MKVALLIGVSEYGYGLQPLPEAVKDIEAMERVLESSNMGGFDEVTTLINPNPPAMREAIQSLFADLNKNDVVLLFFSGNRVKDNSEQLYLATGITATLITERTPEGELVKATAVPVSFVRDIANNCPCQNQVAILNWYFNRDLTPDNNITEDDINTQLRGERLAILTSSIYSQISLEGDNPDISVYTRYLVEGIEKGAADRDRDGWISAEDLHEYVKRRVTEAAPAWIPVFYFSHNRRKIILTKVQINEKNIRYRQEVERWASRGRIAQLGCGILDKLAISLQLNPEDCRAIEAEVMKPYHEYEEKLIRYEAALTTAIENSDHIGTETGEKLQYLRQSLGLRNEDIEPIEARVNLRLDRHSISETDRPISSDSVREEKEMAIAESVSNDPAEAEENQISQLPDRSDGNIIAIVQPIIPLPLVNFPPEDKGNQGTQSDIENEPNSISLTPSLLPWYIQPVPEPRKNLTPTIDSSSKSADPPINPPTPSNLSRKIFLFSIGITGILVAIFVAISFANRAPITPQQKPVNLAPSSNYFSPTLSPQLTETKEVSTTNFSPSPLRKSCWAIVNGNIRSEPASFRENVIQFTKEELLVTGKQTQGGWIQVKFADGSLGWAHRDAIQNDAEMDICILRDGIKIQLVDDIIPPPPKSLSDTSSPDIIRKSRR